MPDVTELLETAVAGGGDPVDRLWPLIYDDLRAMAHRQLSMERRDHSLVTTALVHEAYLKLADSKRVASKGRAYFFAAAGRAMRQVLVDHARARRRSKRGSGERPVALPEGDVPSVAVDDFAVEILDLHEALDRLAGRNPRQARVVEARFFAGMKMEEIAEALEVSLRTVKGDWAFARAWLYKALNKDAPR